jgi:hypothetical protein
MYKNQNIRLFFQVQIKSKMERQTLSILLKDVINFVRDLWLSFPINTLSKNRLIFPLLQEYNSALILRLTLY